MNPWMAWSRKDDEEKRGIRLTFPKWTVAFLSKSGLTKSLSPIDTPPAHSNWPPDVRSRQTRRTPVVQSPLTNTHRTGTERLSESACFKADHCSVEKDHKLLTWAMYPGDLLDAVRHEKTGAALQQCTVREGEKACALLQELRRNQNAAMNCAHKATSIS